MHADTCRTTMTPARHNRIQQGIATASKTVFYEKASIQTTDAEANIEAYGLPTSFKNATSPVLWLLELRD